MHHHHFTNESALSLELLKMCLLEILLLMSLKLCPTENAAGFDSLRILQYFCLISSTSLIFDHLFLFLRNVPVSSTL